MAPHDPHRCFYCGGGDDLQELKPLGPTGAAVCLPCVTDPAHPEREAAAQEVYEQAQRARPPARSALTEVSPFVTDVRLGG